MEIIGSVAKHPNLVPLLAYYYSKDEKLLIYDCAASRSLSSLLHGNRGSGRTLDWETRLIVALGTAKGITHIHLGGGGKLWETMDVYSFGVLLLELLTGKAPIPSSAPAAAAGQDEVADLPKWVQSVVREEWTAEVFDVELIKYQNVEEEMVQKWNPGQDPRSMDSYLIYQQCTVTE